MWQIENLVLVSRQEGWFKGGVTEGWKLCVDTQGQSHPPSTAHRDANWLLWECRREEHRVCAAFLQLRNEQMQTSVKLIYICVSYCIFFVAWRLAHQLHSLFFFFILTRFAWKSHNIRGGGGGRGWSQKNFLFKLHYPEHFVAFQNGLYRTIPTQGYMVIPFLRLTQKPSVGRKFCCDSYAIEWLFVKYKGFHIWQ